MNPQGRSRGVLLTALVLMVVACSTGASAPTPAPPLGQVKSAAAVESIGWQQRAPASQPPGSQRYRMTFDSDRNVAVLADETIPSTWEWNGTNWTQRTSASNPSGSLSSSLVYDSFRKKVFRQGYDGNIADQGPRTYEYDGTKWTKITPAHQLQGIRESFAMTYDSIRHQVVYFGGKLAGSSSYFDETWEYDGIDWLQRKPVNKPPARRLPMSAYDSRRGKTIVYGGFNASNTKLFDTWEWDGTNWKEVVTATKPPGNYGSMAYDSLRGVTSMLLRQGGVLDVWEYDGTDWTRRDSANPPSARDEVGMAFDSKRNEMIVAGGYASVIFQETWTYHGRGNACSGNARCETGACVDGVCCESSACGTCQACNLGTPGVCANVVAGDDLDTCTGTKACSSTAQCLTKQGEACTANAQCASGFCVDKVCCDAACNGACVACAAAMKESGVEDGKCDLVKNGLDPHDTCATSDVAKCKEDGACDGKGACRLYAQGTACGASTCASNAATGSLCNGLGACEEQIGVPCAPGLCTDGSCHASCTSSVQCDPASGFCNGTECEKRRKPGVDCTVPEQCLSGVCADGVCCNKACDGQCEACDVEGGKGQCIPVTDRPHGNRAACASDASDPCKTSSCDGTATDRCAGFVGSSVQCRAATCADGKATLSAGCNGRGQCQDAQVSECSPYACGDTTCKTECQSGADCGIGQRCDLSAKKCISGATCDGDHTITTATNEKIDCAPYRCQGSLCATSCASVNDCVSPDLCDLSGHCVPPAAPGAAPDEGSGCSASSGSATSSSFALCIGVALLALRRRRSGGDA